MKKLNKTQRSKTTKMFKDAFSPSLLHINKTEVMLPNQRQPIFAIDTTPPPTTYPIYFNDSVAYTSFSSYPFRDGKKIGNPICDKGKGVFYSDMCVVCLTDGCGIGRNVFSAAEISANTAIQTVVKNIWNCKTVKDIGELMVTATIDAHFSVIENGANSLQIGTTTFLLTIFVYDIKGIPFVLTLSIGDCRSYRHNHDSNKTFHLNGTTSQCSREVCDCGGRIGPHIDKLYPDLRNAEIFVTQCEEGDSIIITTDGYHDNFDPENLDINPADIGIDAVDWEQAKQNEYFNTKKEIWVNRFLTNIFKTSATPGHFVEQLSEYITTTTSTTRQFAESNPKEIIPKDHHLYPGKCDHSTMIIFKLTQRKEYYPYINSLIPLYSSTLLGGEDLTISRNRIGRTRKYIISPFSGQRCKLDTRKHDVSDPSSLYYTMKSSPQSLSPINISKEHSTPLELPTMSVRFGYPLSVRSAQTEVKLTGSESCFERQELE
ncbi:PPM-type phosphatase domain-containing protein [Entamoeba marina]